MMIDLSKIGFFYQTAKNPCAVEMNLRQIKKYYPNSPVVVWEDITNDCEEMCKNHGVFYKKVYRLPQDLEYHQSQPITELSGGLYFLHRIYISLLMEMKDVEWFIHMEDDVWIQGPVKKIFEYGWSGSGGGGTIISRKAFIESYLKLQEINWPEVCNYNNSTCRYTDRLLSFIMNFNNIPWVGQDFEWCQGGYEDYIIYKLPIIHNIKYWYRHSISELETINTREEVKFFLEHHS
jgi:hypothetical protein